VRHLDRVLPLLLLVAVTMLGAACGKNTKDAGPVFAKVGTHEISENDVDTVIKQQLGGGGGALTPEELTNARLNVLGTLIQRRALFAKAEKENLVPDETKINEEAQKRIRDSKLSKEDYERQLKDAGITEAQWREQIKEEMAINALIEKHVKSAPVEQPTDAEIEKYYSDRRAEFVTARGCDISVIVTDPRNNQPVESRVRFRHYRVSKIRAPVANTQRQPGIRNRTGTETDFPFTPPVATTAHGNARRGIYRADEGDRGRSLADLQAQ
jgi:hypothetical protein